MREETQTLLKTPISGEGVFCKRAQRAPFRHLLEHGAAGQWQRVVPPQHGHSRENDRPHRGLPWRIQRFRILFCFVLVSLLVLLLLLFLSFPFLSLSFFFFFFPFSFPLPPPNKTKQTLKNTKNKNKQSHKKRTLSLFSLFSLSLSLSFFTAKGIGCVGSGVAHEAEGRAEHTNLTFPVSRHALVVT